MHVNGQESLRAGVDTHEVLLGDSELTEQLTGKQFVEVGARNLEFVPLAEIHLLHQPRRSYDSNTIEALARAMVPDWQKFEAATTLEEIEACIDMYNPPLINRVSPDYLPTYLEDHARLYRIPTPVLYTEPGENIAINAGGHTRYLANEFLLKYKGFTKENGRMLCNVRYNMSHAETLAMQIRENIKTNPSPEDLAFIIERIANDYEDRHHAKPTHKQLSLYTGLSEGIIGDGLAFTSLPRRIQDYVGDPRNERKKKKNGNEFRAVIPYSKLVRLRSLQDDIAKKYDQDRRGSKEYSVQARDAHVEVRLQIVAKKIANDYIAGVKEYEIQKYITGQINAAKSALEVEQLEMIYVPAAHNVRGRHDRASATLAKKCIETLRLMAEQGHLPRSHADELREVYELFEDGTRQEEESSIQEAMF